jgi:hypothetical protein
LASIRARGNVLPNLVWKAPSPHERISSTTAAFEPLPPSRTSPSSLPWYSCYLAQIARVRGSLERQSSVIDEDACCCRVPLLKLRTRRTVPFVSVRGLPSQQLRPHYRHQMNTSVPSHFGEKYILNSCPFHPTYSLPSSTLALVHIRFIFFASNNSTNWAVVIF